MKDIIQTQYCDEMQKSYLDYSMSVITDRAVPDVRDGLKPVQRRTIFAMYKLGLDYNKPHRKSARIVGDTMGKYHPHGDTSIYDSLVVMGQDFKKKISLVDCHGNFGSVEGDGAAAMRYTEARLKEFTMDVYLADVDKDVVDFRSNFDETEKEPVVLPARLPMALINGSEGIAVGMTTSIAPHNLDEVIDAMKLFLSGNVSDKKLYETIVAPDFPLPCEIMNASEMREIYSTGHGKLLVRGLMHEEIINKKNCIVIDALPPSQLGLGIARFLDDMVSLCEKKIIQDVSDIRNETDESGIRIVIELKKDANAELIKKLIESKTRYTDTIPISMLVIDEGKAVTMSLRQIIERHLVFLKDINVRKYNFLLSKARDREEILEGLIRAVDCIDLIIEILRGSKNIDIAKNCLINGITDGIKFKSSKSKKMAEKLYFTKLQAQAILDMRLSKLIGLEIEALNDEYKEVLLDIEEYEKLLKDDEYLKKRIKLDLNAIKKKYHQDRVTIVSNVEKEKVVITKKEELYSIDIDENGYIKADKPKEDAIVLGSFDKLILFTSMGRQLQIKVEDIPKKSDNSKGVPIENLCDFDRSFESILYITSKNKLMDNVLFITENGLAKIVDSHEFDVSTQKSKATKLKDDDSLILVKEVQKDDVIVVKTSKNKIFKIKISNVHFYKKGTQGSKLFNMAKGTTIVEATVVNENEEIAYIDGMKVELREINFKS